MWTAPLEIRASGNGGRRITGKFKYNSVAVLSDGGRTGRPQKEKFAPGAFKFSVDEFNKAKEHFAKNGTSAAIEAKIKADIDAEMSARNIHLLSGHDFAKPLADGKTGTLSLEDTPESLNFEAEITPEVAATSWAADVFALIAAGLAIGLSPGFRLPPERAVPRKDAEKIEQEPHDPDRGMHGAIIRTLLAVVLFELSIVTRPAYPDASVEARAAGLIVPRRRGLYL